MKPDFLKYEHVSSSVDNNSMDSPHDNEPRNSWINYIIMPVSLALIAFSAFIVTPHLIEVFNKKTVQQVEVLQAKSSTIITAQEHYEAYLWTTKLKLEELKLNHRLQIAFSDQMNLRIQGTISKEEQANWEQFQAWYETKEGFPRLDATVSATATSGNIPELESVWFDRKPTAYFIDGGAGTIGTVLDNGWKIVSIETWAVFVERNGTTITLSY